jgi:glutathione S-transferase
LSKVDPMNKKCIKIWGRKDSSNVQKVLWCCGELDLAFDRIDFGGTFGGNKEASYLRINPNGLVPTVEDDGFVLWESNSIVRYLIEKYGEGRLTPPTPEGRADANRWMDWQLTTLGPAMVPLFWGLIRTPAEKRDPATIEQALKKSARIWEILNEHLAKSPFVAGNNVSFGDIPLGIWAYRWFKLPIDRPALGHLQRWFERLAERKAYQTYVMIPLT